MTYPVAGKNEKLDRILIGMHDYASGLDAASLEVTADVAINGSAAGENLGKQFTAKSDGVWELKLKEAPAKGSEEASAPRMNVMRARSSAGNAAKISGSGSSENAVTS